MRHRTALALSIVVLVACKTDPFQMAKVDFLIEAPLCSMTLPVSLTIDGEQVGVDTLVVNYGPPHERTRAFDVFAGTHQLAVRFYPSGILIQEDSVVTLAHGDSYTFRFGFYCS
jgi:hypothetical protein